MLLLVWQNWRPMVASSRTRIGSKNRDQLIPLLDDHLVRETTQYWISILEPVGSLVRLSIDWMRCLLTHK